MSDFSRIKSEDVSWRMAVPFNIAYKCLSSKRLFDFFVDRVFRFIECQLNMQSAGYQLAISNTLSL